MSAFETDWFEPVLHIANAPLDESRVDSIRDEVRDLAIENRQWPQGWVVLPPVHSGDDLQSAQDDLRLMLSDVIDASDAWLEKKSGLPTSRRRASKRDVDRIVKATTVRSPLVKQLLKSFKHTPTIKNMCELRANAARDTLFWSIYERAAGSTPQLGLDYVHSSDPKNKTPFHITLSAMSFRQWYAFALWELLRLGLDSRLRQCEWSNCLDGHRKFFVATNLKGPKKRYCCSNHAQYGRKK